MGIVQCPNGHFYNNDVFDQCPNCNADSMVFGNSDAPTVSVSYGASGMDFSSDASSDFLSDIPSSLPTNALFSEMAAEKKGLLRSTSSTVSSVRSTKAVCMQKITAL